MNVLQATDKSLPIRRGPVLPCPGKGIGNLMQIRYAIVVVDSISSSIVLCSNIIILFTYLTFPAQNPAKQTHANRVEEKFKF